jgi:hypothetical protein
MGMLTDIKKAYKSAKSEYTSMLPMITSRYKDLYSSLANESELTRQNNASLSGVEQTSLKSTLAKRGLSVDNSNPYTVGEANKLSANQNLRQSTSDAGYEEARANTALNETNAVMGVKSALANLTVSKSQDLTAAKQWKKTFEFTKSEAAANRALEIYKATKSGSGSSNNSYKSALATAVSTALTGGYGKNEGIRENIAAILNAKFGDKVSIDTINKDIGNAMPNGWEGRIMESKSNSNAPEVQKVMDALGVDEATATKLIQNELGL